MHITETLEIPEAELRFTFARSGGPGGQNVNKVASKAILHWDLAGNSTLPAEVKERLVARQRKRVTAEGQLLLQCQRYRDQGRNIEDCRQRLRQLILEVLHVPPPRKPTRPTRAARRRRLAAKRHHAERKARRQSPRLDE